MTPTANEPLRELVDHIRAMVADLATQSPPSTASDAMVKRINTDLAALFEAFSGEPLDFAGRRQRAQRG
jgi:hypothetical protein